MICYPFIKCYWMRHISKLLEEKRWQDFYKICLQTRIKNFWGILSDEDFFPTFFNETKCWSWLNWRGEREGCQVLGGFLARDSTSFLLSTFISLESKSQYCNRLYEIVRCIPKTWDENWSWCIFSRFQMIGRMWCYKLLIMDKLVGTGRGISLCPYIIRTKFPILDGTLAISTAKKSLVHDSMWILMDSPNVQYLRSVPSQSLCIFNKIRIGCVLTNC